MARSSLAGMKRVKFELKAEPCSEVFVAGTFNDWNPRKHKLVYKNGVYSTSILVSKGRHEYKFIVNDVWCIDPQCADWAPNPHGSLNSVITVS